MIKPPEYEKDVLILTGDFQLIEITRNIIFNFPGKFLVLPEKMIASVTPIDPLKSRCSCPDK